jgi:uncharacterized lipoprotein YmbA
MTTRHSTLVVMATGVLIPLLMCCSSTPTRTYTLYPVAPVSTPTAYAGPAIRIDAVHIPPALDRIEVVSGLGQAELKVSDQDHWSAPLAELAKQALSADMVARLPSGRVIFPHLAKSVGAAGVNVDILDFRAGKNDAYLEASWIIAPSNSDASHRRTAQLRGSGSDANTTSTADVLSVLLAQLADQIVADLARESNAP